MNMWKEFLLFSVELNCCLECITFRTSEKVFSGVFTGNMYIQ